MSATAWTAPGDGATLRALQAAFEASAYHQTLPPDHHQWSREDGYLHVLRIQHDARSNLALLESGLWDHADSCRLYRAFTDLACRATHQSQLKAHELRAAVHPLWAYFTHQLPHDEDTSP